MASLKSTNPHAKTECTGEIGNYSGSLVTDSTTIVLSWKKALGDAVTDDSKLSFAIYQGEATFIMADIRFIRTCTPKKSDEIVLEFFSMESFHS